jgi:peptide deformylase
MSKVKVLTVWSDTAINEEATRVLRKSCAEMPVPFDAKRKRDIKTLIDDFLAMNDAVGLAAPQIGISKKVIIFRNKGFNEKGWSKSESDYDVLVNPRITQAR